MNSLKLSFITEPIVLILLIIVALGFTLYSYRYTNPPIDNLRKSILIALRTLALGLLLFTIFEPVLTSIFAKVQPPILSLLIDNSKSLTIKTPKKDLKQEFSNVTKQLKELDNISLFTFDEKTFLKEKQFIDSIKQNGELTDISQAFKFVSNLSQDNNTQAYLLVSDGNFNKGDNPLNFIDNLGKPIFVVAIGDTTKQKDASLENILCNETVFINTIVPINITFNATNLDSKEVTVKFLDNGKEVSSQKVSIYPDKEQYSLNFNYTAKQVGTHKFTFQIETNDEETSQLNNSKSEFVKVLENKKKLAIFSGAPSPDYSFVKGLYGKEEGVAIKNYVQLSSNQFLETPTEKDLQDIEMLILIGFPNQYTPQSMIDLVANLAERGKPLLFIASQDLAYNRLGKLANHLPFTVSSSNNKELNIQANVSSQMLSSSLLKITGSEEDLKKWNSLPPIFRTETFVQPKAGSQVVMNMRMNNSIINEPLVITRDLNNRKATAILGYGIYRWKLLGYGSEVAKGNKDAIDLMSIFFDNTYKFLSIQSDSKLFKLNSNKSIYNISEEVIINGQLYDASYAPIDNAEIKVNLTNGAEKREISLQSLGSGKYEAKVQGLSAGEYYYSGDAMQNGIKLGTDNGRFTITKESIELEVKIANLPLLRNIAKLSGGKIYFPNEVNQLQNDLKKLSNFKDRPIVTKDKIDLWNSIYLLIASIVVFGLEWILRKFFGLI